MWLVLRRAAAVATIKLFFQVLRPQPTFACRRFVRSGTRRGFAARCECIGPPASLQFDKTASFSSAAVDPASTSPDLLPPFGQFTATMCRVALRPFYRHVAAGLFLCLLFLPMARRDGFVMRSARVIQGHFQLLHVTAITRRTG